MTEEINVKSVIKHFGGQSELVRRLNAAGETSITIKGVQKWQERNQVPAPWLVKLTSLARSEGREFNLSDFMFAKKESV